MKPLTLRRVCRPLCLLLLGLLPGCKFLADEFYYVDAAQPRAALPAPSDSIAPP